MKQIEFFFDYTCPYCYKEMNKLIELKNEHPLSLTYRPVEIHPYPESADMHSDLASAGAYALQDNEGDMDKYNRLVFQAYHLQHLAIDDPYTIMNLMTMCGVSVSRMELETYVQSVKINNNYVWCTLQVPLVPAYCMDGKLIVGSHDTNDQLWDDLEG